MSWSTFLSNFTATGIYCAVAALIAAVVGVIALALGYADIGAGCLTGAGCLIGVGAFSEFVAYRG